MILFRGEHFFKESVETRECAPSLWAEGSKVGPTNLCLLPVFMTTLRSPWAFPRGAWSLDRLTCCRGTKQTAVFLKMATPSPTGCRCWGSSSFAQGYLLSERAAGCLQKQLCCFVSDLQNNTVPNNVPDTEKSPVGATADRADWPYELAGEQTEKIW